MPITDFDCPYLLFTVFGGLSTIAPCLLHFCPYSVSDELSTVDYFNLCSLIPVLRLSNLFNGRSLDLIVIQKPPSIAAEGLSRINRLLPKSLFRCIKIV